MENGVNNVRVIENISVGHDDQDIVIGINKQDDEFENVYAISADKLKDLIMALFEVGVIYQRETQIDIGFGFEKVGESNDTKERND